MGRRLAFLIVSFTAISAVFVLGQDVSAQTIWSGLTKSFTKAAGTDDTLPENQDPLTADVIFTRGATGGLINFAAETTYTAEESPTLTEWATDLNNPTQTIAATNYANLAFTNWIDAYGGTFSSGTFIADRNAVVHLFPGDIYLDLEFTSWTPGHGNGFSYMRAEPPASLAGDYNQDGRVDAADYVAWRNGASPNPNTIGDYNTWRANFGSGAGSGAGDRLGNGFPVPEPPLSALLIGSLLGFGWQLRGRTSCAH